MLFKEIAGDILESYSVFLGLTYIQEVYMLLGFQGGTEVKNPLANAGDARDTSSTLGLGRFPGEGNGNHSSILA